MKTLSQHPGLIAKILSAPQDRAARRDARELAIIRICDWLFERILCQLAGLLTGISIVGVLLQFVARK